MINNIGEKKNIFIADIRAEKLFREAEDDFFYFNDIKSATQKIEKALILVPTMLKALMMKANISLLEGDFSLALHYYQEAKNVAPNNAKVLAALANMYEINEENEKALEYIERALILITTNTPLYKALIDLKITILIKLKKYLLAQKFINQSKSVLSIEDYKDIYVNNNHLIKQKLKLQKKIKENHLKLVKN